MSDFRPRPDDIETDAATGLVITEGPFVKVQTTRLNRACERNVALELQLTELGRELTDDLHHEHRTFVEEGMAHTERVLATIRRGIPH